MELQSISATARKQQLAPSITPSPHTTEPCGKNRPQPVPAMTAGIDKLETATY